jgi:hypothetical protein
VGTLGGGWVLGGAGDEKASFDPSFDTSGIAMRSKKPRMGLALMEVEGTSTGFWRRIPITHHTFSKVSVQVHLLLKQK